MPNEPEWKYQHDAADKYVLELTNGVELILTDLQKEINISDIEQAIYRGDPAYIIDSIDWEDRFDNRLAKQTESVANSIMAITGTEAWKRLEIPYTFDIRNPYAERYIAEHGAEMVTQVSDETKLAIRSVVLEGMQTGFPPRDMAQRIRPLIGLTDANAKAVLRYWMSLNEDSPDLSQQRRDGMALDYAGRRLKDRALNIARTETISAANQGTLNAWQVARDNGFILPESQKEWIAAMASERTCRYCRELDGKKVGLDEKFHSPLLGKDVNGPTLHPSCRCSISLRTPRIT